MDSWVILANLGAIGTVFHVIAVAAYDRYDLASVFQKFDPSGQETEQYSLWLLVRRNSAGRSSICLSAFFSQLPLTHKRVHSISTHWKFFIFQIAIGVVGFYGQQLFVLIYKVESAAVGELHHHHPISWFATRVKPGFFALCTINWLQRCRKTGVST